MTTARPSGRFDGDQSPGRDLYRAAFADPAERSSAAIGGSAGTPAA